MSGNPNWDRLYFDATSVTLEGAVMPLHGRRPPIYIDTRQLFGIPEQVARNANAPDIAAALQVLRASPERLELDEDGRARRGFSAQSLRAQGWLLEQHVAHLNALTEQGCDGYLFLVYSSDPQRASTVDRREVASWASWHQINETLFCASRHFRARPNL